MAERPALWPLLLYGLLVAIAASRPAPAGVRGMSKRPAPNSEADREPAQSTQADGEKRPRDHFENDQPVIEQKRRAKEPGRGRHATAPWEIPWAGWKDIFWRVYASTNDNRLLAVAAGVVFYSLLAIFPAVAAFVSLYGLVADASTIDAHLSLASGILCPAAQSTFSMSRSRSSRQKATTSSASDSSPGSPWRSGAPMPE